jgi:Cu-processing system permease protein
VIRALLRFELAAARRARTVTLFAAGFALASLAVAVIGLSAGGAVTVQGFARTSVSLLQLVVWVVPMMALLTGAVAGAECHELEFVVGLPLTRGHLLGARWAAWTLALGAALFVGLGAAGIAIALLAGAADGARYLALMLVAWLLLAATLALGLAIGVTARTRARAVGIAIVTWFVLVVGVDLVVIGALAILPPRDAGWGLSLVLLADPVDAARAFGLGLFRADAIAGPTGAALRRVLGGWGAWVLLAGLVAWTALPLALAGRWFARRDL